MKKKYGVWVPSDKVLSVPIRLMAELDLTRLGWYSLQDLEANCTDHIDRRCSCDTDCRTDARTLLNKIHAERSRRLREMGN